MISIWSNESPNAKLMTDCLLAWFIHSLNLSLWTQMGGPWSIFWTYLSPLEMWTRSWVLPPLLCWTQGPRLSLGPRISQNSFYWSWCLSLRSNFGPLWICCLSGPDLEKTHKYIRKWSGSERPYQSVCLSNLSGGLWGPGLCDPGRSPLNELNLYFSLALTLTFMTKVWVLVFQNRAMLTSGLQDWTSPTDLNSDPAIILVLDCGKPAETQAHSHSPGNLL